LNHFKVLLESNNTIPPVSLSRQQRTIGCTFKTPPSDSPSKVLSVLYLVRFLATVFAVQGTLWRTRILSECVRASVEGAASSDGCPATESEGHSQKATARRPQLEGRWKWGLGIAAAGLWRSRLRHGCKTLTNITNGVAILVHGERR
jgi:hypothetical protein